MKTIKKIVDFYLYSGIHLALGASMSVILCYAVFKHIPNSDYSIFVFSATLLLYCLYQLISIQQGSVDAVSERFEFIKMHKTHISLYALLGAMSSIYFYVNLSLTLKLWILLPAAISLLYFVPSSNNDRKLGDYSFLKILLLAIIWGLVIGIIPYIEAEGTLDWLGLVYGLEKTVFIFAITLPFVARNIEIAPSGQPEVKSKGMSNKGWYKLAYFSMALVIFLIIVLYAQDVYSFYVGLAVAIAYQLAGFTIKISRGKNDDYYYSGLLNGTIALVAIAGIISSGILNVIF